MAVHNSPHGLCGRKGTLNSGCPRAQEVAVHNSPHGLCGRKGTLNLGCPRAQELCGSGGGRAVGVKQH